MNNGLKKHITIAVKLAIICFISTLLLTITNFLTKDTIDKYEKKMENEANKIIFDEGAFFERKKFPNIDTDSYYYTVFNSENELIGYIVTTIAKGYGGDMKLVIGFEKNLAIKNMKLLSNNETPGIGKKAEESSYMQKFIGSNTLSRPFPQKKDQLSSKDRDAITGATITFNGITSATKEAIYLLSTQKDVIENSLNINNDLSTDTLENHLRE